MTRIFSAAFNAALTHVLEAEGGWSDHKADPGGATMYGITLKVFREWRRNSAVGKADLKAITLDEVREIYHDLYWRTVQGDKLHPAVALMVFDAAVNSGPKNAIKALQASAARFSPYKLIADGVLGPQSLPAINSLEPRRVLNEFGARRSWFYGLLKTFSVFGLGWSRRLFAARAAAELLLARVRTMTPAKEPFTWPTS